MKYILLILLFSAMLVNAVEREEIDYQGKSLAKVLQKYGLKVQDLKPIEANELFLGSFYKVYDTTNTISYVYIGRVNSCRAGGCTINSGNNEATNSEYFDYFMLFDKSKAVKLVKVFNYQATHGQEVTARGWLKQFIGFKGEKELIVNKNIDAISGATISVDAITFDVQEKTVLLQNLAE